MAAIFGALAIAMVPLSIWPRLSLLPDGAVTRFLSKRPMIPIAIMMGLFFGAFQLELPIVAKKREDAGQRLLDSAESDVAYWFVGEERTRKRLTCDSERYIFVDSKRPGTITVLPIS